ncbi:MAG: DUF4199 domain-containing protein [Saprospiraceae bacterium]|nr:DUF4199 domain-containing protein [Saprospiraceae bacterium]
MNQHFVNQGMLYAAATILITLALYFTDAGIMMKYSSWIVYLAALYFMVLAVQNTRNDNGGYIALSEAFKQAWLVFVIGISLHSAFSYVLYNYIDSSLLDVLRETQMESLEKMAKTFKMDEETLNKAKAEIEAENPFNLKALLIALPVSYLFPGSLMAIVIAAILKKDPPVA